MEGIALQKIGAELDEDEQANADWQGGFEFIVEQARATLLKAQQQEDGQ